MKKKLFFGICLLFLILLTLSSCASAVEFYLSPSEFSNSNALKGGEYEYTVNIRNAEDDSNFLLFSEGDGGEWMTFYSADNENEAITSIEIEEEDSEKVIVKIKIPEDAANGHYNPKFYIKNSPIVSDSEEGGSISAGVLKIPVNFNIDVSGEQVLSGEVRGISIRDTEVGRPLRLVVNFMNTGNVMAKPEIYVNIIKDNENIDSFSFSEIGAKPSQEIEIPVLHDTKDFAVGEYELNVNVSLGDESLAEKNLTLNILEKGTLSRAGELHSIDVEGNPELLKMLKVVSNFENTGLIDTLAKFKGEVYLNGGLVDIIESDEFLVPVGESEDLVSYYKIAAPGNYEIKGNVLFEDKKSDLKEVSFKVSQPEVPAGDSKSKAVPGFGIAGVIGVLIAGILICRRKYI